MEFVTSVVLACVFTALHVSKVFSEENTYEFGKNCTWSGDTIFVSSNSTFHIEYKGENVSSSCSKLYIASKNDNSLANTVCLTPLYFYDPQCSVRLELKSSLAEMPWFAPDLVVTCTENNNRTYCFKANYFSMRFVNQNDTSTSDARFAINVSIWNYQGWYYGIFCPIPTIPIWTLICIIVGCCVMMVLILVPISRYLCKVKRSKGKIINLNLDNTAPLNQQDFISCKEKI